MRVNSIERRNSLVGMGLQFPAFKPKTANKIVNWAPNPVSFKSQQGSIKEIFSVTGTAALEMNEMKMEKNEIHIENNGKKVKVYGIDHDKNVKLIPNNFENYDSLYSESMKL